MTIETLKSKIMSFPTRTRLALVIGIGLLLVVAVVGGYFTFRADYLDYPKPKYAIVSTDTAMFLREGPSTTSERISALYRDSVFKVTGETRNLVEVQGIGKAKWFRVETYADQSGWGFGSLLKFISEEEAGIIRRKQHSRFEDAVRAKILTAAQRRIIESGMFALDRMADVRITTPIERRSAASYDVEVRAFMVGALLGINKKQVRTTVNLEMEIDRNLLPRSTINVRQVDILDYALVEGITPGQGVDLLINITK